MCMKLLSTLRRSTIPFGTENAPDQLAHHRVRVRRQVLHILRQDLQQESNLRLAQRLHHVLEVRREVEEALRLALGELLLHELLPLSVGAGGGERRAFHGGERAMEGALGHAKNLSNVAKHLQH